MRTNAIRGCNPASCTGVPGCRHGVVFNAIDELGSNQSGLLFETLLTLLAYSQAQMKHYYYCADIQYFAYNNLAIVVRN